MPMEYYLAGVIAGMITPWFSGFGGFLRTGFREGGANVGFGNWAGLCTGFIPLQLLIMWLIYKWMG